MYLRHCVVMFPEEGTDCGVTVSRSVITMIYENNGQRRPDTYHIYACCGWGFVMGKTIMYKNACSHGMTQRSQTCGTPHQSWGIVHCDHCTYDLCSNILSAHSMAGTPHHSWGIVQYGRYTYDWCRNTPLLQEFSSAHSRGTVLVSRHNESRTSISESIRLNSLFSGSVFSFMSGFTSLALFPSTIGHIFADFAHSTIQAPTCNCSAESFSTIVAVSPCSCDTKFPYRVFPDFYGLRHLAGPPVFAICSPKLAGLRGCSDQTISLETCLQSRNYSLTTVCSFTASQPGGLPDAQRNRTFST